MEGREVSIEGTEIGWTRGKTRDLFDTNNWWNETRGPRKRCLGRWVEMDRKNRDESTAEKVLRKGEMDRGRGPGGEHRN